MVDHVVKAGESLSKIANQYGLKNWQELYNHPSNASFRAKRPNPNLIQPGDRINIPGNQAGPGQSPSAAPARSNPAAAQQPAVTQWLMLATDGTDSVDYHGWYEKDDGSRGYNLSYCKQWERDSNFAGSQGLAKHFDGPNTLGGNVPEKVEEGKTWLSQKMPRFPHAKIVLVGHSRGGMVAVLIAKWLQSIGQSVEYLGLYDAVDRTPNIKQAVLGGAAGGYLAGGLGATVGAGLGLGSHAGMDARIIPANVVHCRHALRDPGLGSRWWFGNTATEWANAGDAAWKKLFWATHGSVGGAKPEGCGTSWGFGIYDSCEHDISKQTNLQKGRDADQWIREGARKLGFPI